jgi:hypothetical protein
MSRPALRSSELRLSVTDSRAQCCWTRTGALKRLLRQRAQIELRAGTVSHRRCSDCVDALSFRSKQRPDICNGDTKVARLDDELEPSPEPMVDLGRQQATPDEEPHRFLCARVVHRGVCSRVVFH